MAFYEVMGILSLPMPVAAKQISQLFFWLYDYEVVRCFSFLFTVITQQ